jgi:NTP pyrophosphatase (non-canonical NTP hydrolase)
MMNELKQKLQVIANILRYKKEGDQYYDNALNDLYDIAFGNDPLEGAFERLSDEAVRFVDENIGQCVLPRKIRKLGEEVAEFCEAVGSKDNARAREELGDVLLIVIHMAHALNTTPFDLLFNTLEKLEIRLKTKL